MGLQFQNSPLSYLRMLTHQKQPLEQTQEVRLPEGMSDIGTVLGAWGQVILRSKQWNSNSVGLSAGVMVWVLYAPEDGGTPCTVEVWVPFQQKFDLPDTQGREGAIHCAFTLAGVDARSTSARKLFVRVCVDTLLDALMGEKTELYQPQDIPEDVQLLKNTYPVILPMEAGERSFELEETLELPGSCPRLKKIIYYLACPRLQEKKVLSDKVVFRGSANVRMLYLAEDDLVYSWDFDVPFSQYGELDREYEPDAAADVRMVLTSAELEPDEQGSLRLNLGMVGQYVVRQRHLLPVTQDAYSPNRTVQLRSEQLPLPVILDRQDQKITAQQQLNMEGLRLADVSFFCRDMLPRQEGDSGIMELSGQFQVLCYDLEGKLTGTTCRWEQSWTLPTDRDTQLYVRLSCEPSQGVLSGGGANVESDLILDVQTVAAQGLEAITGLELGEWQKSSADRPSLIICRAGKDGLWSVAKATGSTVEAIQKANKLEQEPEPDSLLLIPIHG